MQSMDETGIMVWARRCRSGLLLTGGMLLALGAQAGMVSDAHGNVGYDTAAECEAAVRDGSARFYQPITRRAPRLQAGEKSVRTIRLSELSQASARAFALRYRAADYVNGACDVGVRGPDNRPEISEELLGKWVPFAPDMALNLYSDAGGNITRATMAECDNRFADALPRPVPSLEVAAAPQMSVAPEQVQAEPNQCFANILVPARFETLSKEILLEPATRRQEVIPATYRTVTEQVLERPETRREVAVPAQLETVTEQVEVRPAGTRTEPVPPVFKTHVEQVETRPATRRVEVEPPSYRTEHRRVEVAPAHTQERVIPAVYDEVEEQVLVRPATTRTRTVPARYRTETERVLVRPEILRYIPVRLPMKRVGEKYLRAEAGTRLEALPPVLQTVSEPVLVQEASVHTTEVPAAYELVTERIKVKDAYREWRRGRAWVGQAIEVVPVRSFIVDETGEFRGMPVQGYSKVPAARGGPSRGVLDTGLVPSDNRNLEDDVWCLVEVPAQYREVQRRVLKAAATTSEEAVPAKYRNVARKIVLRDAQVREVPVPAQYQTVYRPEVDFARARELGYKFSRSGEPVESPTGERLLRASEVARRPGAQMDAGVAPDAWVREVRVPAHYRDVTRYVLEEPERVELEELAAVYRTVRRRVEVEPARTETVAVPAQYRDVAVQVMKPQATRAVDEPAEYAAVTHFELQEPTRLRQTPVPAMTRELTREVVRKPAGVREEVVPAVYRTLERQVVDQPAQTRWVDVPARYKTISWEEKVSDAREEVRAVLCETNAAPETIRNIQLTLQRAGFDPGSYDGELELDTLQAVARYQQAHGLPVHGYLDVDTVRALGVSY